MKRTPKTESVEAANRRRRSAARAVGAGIYESRDPDDPEAPPVWRCDECDDVKGSPAGGCPRSAAHAPHQGELFAEFM